MIILVKTYSNYQIKSRIKMNLCYDDLMLISIIMYMSDYMIIYKFMLFEEVSILAQIVVIFNFITIQTKVVLNRSLLGIIYNYCMKQKVFMLANIIIVQLIYEFMLLFLTELYVYLFKYYLINLFVFVLGIFQKLIKTDNRKA